MRQRPTHLLGTLLPLAAVLLLATACGGADAEGPAAAPSVMPDGPLRLTTVNGLAAVDARSGAVAYEAPGAVASPDGSIVARAVVRPDGTTRVFWLDPADGRRTAVARIEEPAAIRVVAPDGRVALGPPDIPLGGIVRPVARAATALTVAAPDGTVRTYHLDGSIEPEAFSTDGASLFVLGFTPAENPTEYQVNKLDLTTGEIDGVYGQDSPDERQERMGGIARTQVWDPDGDVVYTLYSQEVGGRPTSFIHVLDLDEGWAFCLDLPQAIGWSSPAALAVAPDGARLWVTDSIGHGAVVDTEALEVLAAGRFRAPGPYGLSAVSDGERLYVGSGDRITVLDGDDLSRVARWRTSRTIYTLRLDPVDERLVAVTDGQLTTFPLGSPERDPAGRDLPFSQPIVVTDPTLVDAECAC